ncbi:MAG TPA: DUF4365 domain-containing protein [Gemmataceae bacterium]|nr:DUF4365 domain-containing protein [Gemmataceae bacterium]
MKVLPRKRRTRQHIIADLSANHVQRHALLAGYVIEQAVHDYGIDLELITFNKKGEVQEGGILVQLKASDRIDYRANQTAIGVRLDRRDLARWLGEPMPVVLIVYGARKDIGYWEYVQRHFERLADFNIFAAPKTVTIFVSVANVVTVDAMRQFALFRYQITKRIGKLSHDET